MKCFSTRLLALGSPLLLLASCANRSEFVPDGGPVTVAMPAELSDRERTYVSEVDGALRGENYQPVRHGAGDGMHEMDGSKAPQRRSPPLPASP